MSDLIHVTMSRDAAAQFKRALTTGSVAIEHAKGHGGEAEGWLDWGRARVELAEREGCPYERALAALVDAVGPMLDEDSLGSHEHGDWVPVTWVEMEYAPHEMRAALDAFYRAREVLGR